MEHIIHLLLDFKYLILFPLAIVEGPIIAVIAGLLCSRGFLNPLLVYIIIVSGDLVGDSFCYSLGRWGKSKLLQKIIKRLGLNKNKMDRIRVFFDSNPAKTISLSKIILGIGVAGIIFAGNARIPYNKFFRICLVTSAVQYIFYLGIGILFGHAYIQINHYLNYFASISILAAIAFLLFYFIKSMLNKL